MIYIGLCDDDISILDFYSNELEKISEIVKTPLRIRKFISGESLLFNLEENPNQLDIIVIDILMNNINGIDTMKILRSYGYKGIIIFLTSSTEFALDAFEVNASNYLIKNSELSNNFNSMLINVILKVKNKTTKKLILETKKNRIIIDLKNIIYIESCSRKIIFHSLYSSPVKVSSKLNYVYEKINDFGFIRCHKSFIINVNYVIYFNNIQCTLKNNIQIPIGKKYLVDFKNKFTKFEFENILI